MKLLHIGKPYIKKEGHFSKLCSNIKYGSKSKILFYMVDSEFEDCLCIQRSDAFLLSILNFAMSNGYDIEWEIPVTERLFYQLTYIYLPVIKQLYSKKMRVGKLIGPVTNDAIIKKNRGVATGISGGVDSFYSILKHLNISEKSFQLTNVVFLPLYNNIKNYEELEDKYARDLENIKKISKNMKLPLISIFTNEPMFFYNGIPDWEMIRIGGMVLSIQNLISVYYVSSAYKYINTHFINASSAACYDVFNASVFSTENIQFIGSGGEVGRREKVKFIENNNIVQKTLHVCNFDGINNCSFCEKCMRTMMQLYADDVLDLYGKVFDLDKFNKNKNKYIARMIYRNGEFDKEILEDLKQSGKNIGLLTKIRAFILRIAYLIWQSVQKNKFLMKIFYKYNLDYKLYHKELADSIRYTRGVKLK